MGVVSLLGLLIGSFAILSASVSSKSSPQEYSAADGETSLLVLEVERFNEEPARLKGKLEDVGVSVGEEKTEGNATLKTTMEVTTESVSTASVVHAPAWVLGGQTEFKVSQATGGWHWIEAFGKDYRPRVDPCEEYIFNLTGSTVERTQRWGKSGDKLEIKGDFTVDTQSPHRWRDDWLSYTWLKTDYAKWGVVMCRNKELSDCSTLHILSRERTLPPATLEMLRNVAEQRGFNKSHGVLEDQTSCCSEGEKEEDNATLKWTKEETTENASTALSVNAPAWELGDETAFNLSQAMGGWHSIEEFESLGRPSPDPCVEVIFNLKGSTVERTYGFMGRRSGDKIETYNNLTVDSQSPNQWTSEDWGMWTWVTTDYANWAVLLRCGTKELSSCNSLRILSRERTLPPATLEMLRNVAEQRGFPKEDGALVDQTACLPAPARLKGNLEDVGVSVENTTLKWTMEVTTENVSTALGVNASAWELGGQTAFDVSQAMGVWRYIEVFGKYDRPYFRPCEERNFNLTGSTIEETLRWGKSGHKDEGKVDLTVDTQSPHHWRGGFVWRWVMTDYANWAVLMWCRNKELRSCDHLLILSRERTLPPATLEKQRNVAEQRGFPKTNGVLVDQTSC